MISEGVTLDGREASEDTGSFTSVVEVTNVSGSCIVDVFTLLPSLCLLSTSSSLVNRDVFDLMLISLFDIVSVSPEVLFLISEFRVQPFGMNIRYNDLNKMNIFSHHSDLIVL